MAQLNNSLNNPYFRTISIVSRGWLMMLHIWTLFPYPIDDFVSNQLLSILSLALFPNPCSIAVKLSLFNDSTYEILKFEWYMLNSYSTEKIREKEGIIQKRCFLWVWIREQLSPCVPLKKPHLVKGSIHKYCHVWYHGLFGTFCVVLIYSYDNSRSR